MENSQSDGDPEPQRDFNNTNSVYSLPLGADASSIRTIQEATSENVLWHCYHMDRQREVRITDIPSLKPQFSGTWKIISSDSTLYLQSRNLSELETLAFNASDLHLEFTSDSVNIHHQLGDQNFNRKSFKLLEPMHMDSGVSCISYFINDSLKTIYLFVDENGREEQEFETRTLTSDGKLEVVLERERGGVKSVRIYGRSLQDLKDFHISQLQAKVKEQEMEHEKKEKMLQQEISTLQDKLISLQVPAPNEQPQSTKTNEKIAPPISMLIGNWQDVKNPAGTTSLNISGNQFIRKWNGGTFIDELGVKRAGGRYTYVDGEKIVHKALGEREEVLYVSEYSMENGLMVYTGYPPNGRQNAERYEHRRIGEPI